MKKRTKITIIAVIIFLFASLVAFVYQYFSKYMSINGTYMTVYSIDFSNAEYKYFYNEAIYEYMEANASLLDYTGLMVGVDYSKQYRDKDNNVTWADYFSDKAMEKLENIALLCKSADEANYIYDEEKINAYIADIKDNLSERAHEIEQSLDEYIGQAYISGAEYNDIKPAIEKQAKAETYKQYIKENIEYTTEDIFKYYDENSKKYDIVDFRAIVISTTEYMNKLSSDYNRNDYDSDDSLKEAVYDAATKQVESDAESIFENVKSEDDFIKYAEKYASEEVRNSSEGEDISLNKNIDYSSANMVYKDWLFDDARTYGSMCLMKEEQSGNYYVLFFINRSKNRNSSITYEQILIPYPNDGNSGEISPENRNKGIKKAEDIYKEIQKENLTQDIFEDYADKYNEDYSTQNSHGLKVNMAKNNVPSIAKDWLFSQRTPGDITLIHDSDCSFIFYYISSSDEYWYKKATSDYIDEKYNTILKSFQLNKGDL